MLDIEFTIQEGRLWMLQCRVGKRNGPAAVRMAVDMFQEKMISAEEAVSRVTPDQLDEVLHPIVDPRRKRSQSRSPRDSRRDPRRCGVVVFTAEEAVKAREADKKTKVILVREETNPEDVDGMRAAEGILTARGGMTSHAALVARGWGKCCIVGAGEIEIDVHKRVMTAAGVTIRAGEYITLNGTKGYVYAGQLPLVKITEDNPFLQAFLKLCDKVRKINIRTNADTPADAAKARAFGAEGIGLFRTEHMFYGEGSDKPLAILRKLIMAQTSEERRKFCDELFPFVKAAVKGTLEAMSPYPVTIRLLDPPLHEFVPEKAEGRAALAKEIGITLQELEDRAKKTARSQPDDGTPRLPPRRDLSRNVRDADSRRSRSHRGTAQGRQEGHPRDHGARDLRRLGTPRPEGHFRRDLRGSEEEIRLRKFEALYGTMIEIPRAALKADEMAEVAEFFSYGTNDLTQMTFGFSRDDVGAFMPAYLAKGLLPADPFQTLDQSAVGELIAIGVERGRATRPGLKIGICGEHGGDPASVHFCHRVGMNYVSCSPFRVPIARLAAAQAALKYGEPGDMLRCSCCEEPAPKRKPPRAKSRSSPPKRPPLPR
jgi:pyruvate,orthophosphate dikinase